MLSRLTAELNTGLLGICSIYWVTRNGVIFCSNFPSVTVDSEVQNLLGSPPNVLIPTNHPQRRLQPHEIYRFDPYLRFELFGPHFARNWSGSVPENSADYA